MDSVRKIAHDLNNIAFVISGYAQRLEEELGKDNPLQPDVQAILDEIPRLTAVGERIRCLAAPAGARAHDIVPVHDTRRILLVDDEPAIRDLLRQALERRGYSVETSSTGADALALCEAIDPPDLLITDLMLPGASGLVIAERMRRRAPKVGVLIMSGYEEHPLLAAAKAAGESCLVKPFEIAKFNDTVARLLDTRRAA